MIVANQSGNYSGPSWVDISVATLWTLVLVYGLLTNVLVTVTIVLSKSLRKSTSYWLMVSLAVCDIAMIVICLSFLVPATILHDEFVTENDTFNWSTIFVYDIFWYSGVMGLCCVAVNRFISVMFPMSVSRDGNSGWFNNTSTAILIAVQFSMGLGCAMPAAFECCRFYYDHDQFVTLSVDAKHIGSQIFTLFDTILNSSVCVVMFICYVSIFMKVRRSRQSTERMRNHGNTSYRAVATNETNMNANGNISYQEQQSRSRQREKKEFRLLIQFCLVSFVFLASFVTWQIIIKVGVYTPPITITMTSLFYVNNLVNPTIYLIFNSALRKHVKKLFFQRFLDFGLHSKGKPHQGSNLPLATAEALPVQHGQNNKSTHSTSDSDQILVAPPQLDSLYHTTSV